MIEWTVGDSKLSIVIFVCVATDLSVLFLASPIASVLDLAHEKCVGISA